MGPINPSRKGLNAKVSTVTRMPERTQQIHHSGVYAYVRQRVTQAHDDRQSRATHDRTMRLTRGTNRALL